MEYSQYEYSSTQSLIHDVEEYLASNVAVNYNACLVNFLKEQGEITEDEASAILATGAMRAGRQKTVREDRAVLRSIGILHAVVLAVLLFGGIIIQLTSNDRVNLQKSPTVGIALAPSEAGYLMVIAEPWAEVRVDGVSLETTPFANPLALTPGVHYVELTHPNFETVSREIMVKPQETVKLFETLAKKDTNK